MGPFSVFRWLIKTFLEVSLVGAFFLHRGYGSAGCLIAFFWLPGAMFMTIAVLPLHTWEHPNSARPAFFIFGFFFLFIAGMLNRWLRGRQQRQQPNAFGGRQPPGASP